MAAPARPLLGRRSPPEPWSAGSTEAQGVIEELSNAVACAGRDEHHFNFGFGEPTQGARNQSRTNPPPSMRTLNVKLLDVTDMCICVLNKVRPGEPKNAATLLGDEYARSERPLQACDLATSPASRVQLKVETGYDWKISWLRRAHVHACASECALSG